MITLTLFPVVGGTRVAEFELNSLKQGVDFLLFSLENLSSKAEEGLSLAIRERGNDNFPTIHFQQLNDKCFFQIYVCGQPDNAEEGWYCLVDKNFTQQEHDLITTTWDEPQGEYFQARFADGVLISKSLLVSKKTFENTIYKYSEEISQWLKQSNWINVGLI